MAKRAVIPDAVRQEVEAIVANFNKTEVPHYISYSARFRGRYLYLDRKIYARSGPICRLGYNGAMDNWDFAIFKYSDEQYDPNEWFFPGAGEVNGTVAGALRAGMAAYPA